MPCNLVEPGNRKREYVAWGPIKWESLVDPYGEIVRDRIRCRFGYQERSRPPGPHFVGNFQNNKILSHGCRSLAKKGPNDERGRREQDQGRLGRGRITSSLKISQPVCFSVGIVRDEVITPLYKLIICSYRRCRPFCCCSVEGSSQVVVVTFLRILGMR